MRCAALQGSESLSHLRKLAQNFPTQETGGLGGIEEDDEVPGEWREGQSVECWNNVSDPSTHLLTDLVENFDEPSKSEN